MKKLSMVVTGVLALVLMMGCQPQGTAAPVSDTGVRKVTAKIQTGSDGLTVEQRNVKQRLEDDNKPGSIKHLYVVSAMTGDVLIYSTVKGKVTSSGKRLTPTSVVASGADLADQDGIPVRLGNRRYHTSEVLQDDGTYGSSVPYVYWYDQRGIYHQHYITGGQIFHVADAPLAVNKAIINMEDTGSTK